MTYPRAHLVDEKRGGYYHCVSRCVRRAWLCGRDPVSGTSYSHRREWLERKILRLSKHYAIDLCAYAVMSNHYHMVIRTVPNRTVDWSADEVARRWLSRHGKPTNRHLEQQVKELASQPKRIQLLRRRLASLSWFMRDINEPMARMANAEDDCKGRFWEGRFKSVALLDHNAIINCMVYVELNPVRANPKDSTPSRHTSALLRREARSHPLLPLSTLGLNRSSYLRLIDWTHQATSAKQASDNSPRKILARLGQSEAQWLKNVRAHSAGYRAYGLPKAIEAYVKRIKQSWIQMPGLRSKQSHLESPPAISA